MNTIGYTWHVLAVKDLDASVAYFKERMGFEELMRAPGKVFLKLMNFRIMIGDCPDAVPARDTGDHSYFAYVVCDHAIDAIFSRFVQQRAIISSQLDDKPWGMREFNVDTPEGHRMVFGMEIKES